MELIAEDSPVSLKPKASLDLMVSGAEAVAEVVGEAVVVETSEDKTMASEDVEVPEGGEEDLVAKVARPVPGDQISFFLFPGLWSDVPEAQQGFDNFDE